MKFLSNSVLLFALGSAALPGPAQENNVLEPRRAASCTNYVAANAKLTQCQTNTAYCTRFLGRGPSTTTSFTSTVRKTSTPPVVTVKSTTTTRTFTNTVFTSTRTVSAPTFTSIVTSTTTASVTQNVTATSTTTKSVTQTVNTFDTTTTTETTTATVPDIACTPANMKRAEITAAPMERRAAQTPPPPQCGMTTFKDNAVSGACSCLMDRTTSAVTTTTVVLPRSLTTQTIPTVGTTTISAVSTTTFTPTTTRTVTVTPFTVTVATSTVATVTVTPVTTTVATITSTTGTNTGTETSTVTETSIQPRCTQDDRNSYENGNTFVSTCDTNFVGYTAQTTDATDMFDCMYQCQTYNNFNDPYSCVGISFNQAQCNNNCLLKSAIDTGAVTPDPNFQSARVLSPAIGKWGNTCMNEVHEFGDLQIGVGGFPYVILCGMNLLYNDLGYRGWPNITRDGPNAETSCFTDPLLKPGELQRLYSIAYAINQDDPNGMAGCYPKTGYPHNGQIYTFDQGQQEVDIAVRVDGGPHPGGWPGYYGYY